METNAPIEPRSEGRFSTGFGRLRNRLILLVLMTVLPALILAMLNGIEERKAGVARAKMDAVRIAKLAAAQQQGLVENTRHLLGALGDLELIHIKDPKFWNLNFVNLLHLQPIYLNFGLVDADGSLFASALALKGKTNFSQDTFFKKAAGTGNFSVGEFELGSFTNKPALNFGYPIQDTNQHRLSRVIFASLDLSFINQIAAQADLPKDSVLLILDSQSQILYRSLTAARWIGTSIADTPLGKTIRSSIEGTAETMGEDGMERLYAFVPIRNQGEPSLTVVVGIPREIAYVNANRTLLRNLSSLFLIAIAALAGARIYAQRQILDPVQAIVTASKKLAAGDLSARTHLKPGSSELHHLAESFDEMAENLRIRQEEIIQLNADLEQRVAERTAQLQAANKELEAFSYSVSHDLRAPLRHMDGFLSMFEQSIGTGLDEKSRRYLTIISSASKKMGHLIEDLLAFSRMSRVALQKSVVDPNPMVQQVIEECKLDAAGRNIEWKVAPLPILYADPSLMRQVFTNLISNAVKYTRPREQARIEIGVKEGAPATIFIRDNGVGFDMKYVDKLFGVFQRLHGEKEFEGTGIGLANVHRIITRHGGRIWVEAEVNKGAAFFFELPPEAAKA